jgi:uncharacterized membrane protein YhhN
VTGVVVLVAIAAFVTLLLVAEAKASALGRWLSKPAASACFVALALCEGALASRYGRIVFVGLCLAAAGDVLLIPKSVAAFRLGILAFLLGHVAFVIAFLGRGVALPAFVGTLLVVAVVGFVVARWLWPYGGELKGAIAAYVVVISVMVAAAVATTAQRPSTFIAVGALAFYLSDLSVARDRFVKSGFANRLWGLPLYYLAQVLIAKSAA